MNIVWATHFATFLIKWTLLVTTALQLFFLKQCKQAHIELLLKVFPVSLLRSVHTPLSEIFSTM